MSLGLELLVRQSDNLICLKDFLVRLNSPFFFLCVFTQHYYCYACVCLLTWHEKGLLPFLVIMILQTACEKNKKLNNVCNNGNVIIILTK